MPDSVSDAAGRRELTDNMGVKGKKPIQISPLLSPLLLPLLFVVGAVSIPYSRIRRRIVVRRELRFTESMRIRGRLMDWADFVRELDGGNGMLIVERFSFKGPIRVWWTDDNLYETCPYPLVDWFTMAKDATFDPVRHWCRMRYTGVTGEAMLVTGTKDQWRTIQGEKPLTFREGVQFVEVPPPPKS